MTKIVLLGAGHLAVHFYEQFTACPKVHLIQWYNRSIQKIYFAKEQIKITDQEKETLIAGNINVDQDNLQIDLMYLISLQEQLLHQST